MASKSEKTLFGIGLLALAGAVIYGVTRREPEVEVEPAPLPPPVPADQIRFDLINASGAPRWAINALYLLGNTGYFYGSVRADLGQPIYLYWDTIVAWAGGNPLSIDISLRDTAGQFVGAFGRIDASALMSGRNYTINWLTRTLVR